MSSRRRSRPALLPQALLCASALSLLVGGCNKKDKEPSTDPIELIPAEMHGVFGRSAEDAPGLKVSATGLEFRTMKLIIHEGKMEGSTVRIERATLAWEKLEPKTCNGTISRQGDHLLLSLFDANNPEAKCESILDAKWQLWTRVEAIPEMMQGRYGSLLVAEKSMKLDVGWLHSELEVGTIWQLPGTNDERTELLVDMAKVRARESEGAEQGEAFMCDGTLTFAEDRLEAHFFLPPALEPAPGSDEAKDPELQAKLDANRTVCEDWQGADIKFTVNLEPLPKQPIAAGETKLTISEKEVVLASPDMTCTQELWKTETVDSRAGWNGAQFGGERMTLGKAEPSGVSEDCKLKIRIYCEGQSGVAPGDIKTEEAPNEYVAACMTETEHGLCPEAITVREISDTRYKVNVEPELFNVVACLDPTPEFVVQ